MLFNLFMITIAMKVVTCAPQRKNTSIDTYIDNPAIQRFREYVQIDTSVPENVEHAVEFWRKQAKDLGLLFTVYRPSELPICVITWPGMFPDLPSIMLNSHMDVVDVTADLWKYPPFSAYMDDNGDIYGRGTQDDKDVAIQYLEAVRKLKNDNVTLQRSVHITLMPDEETGGKKGMARFIETEFFTDLNVGFALDEGITSNDDTVYVTYQDKRPWQIKFTLNGESGHASSIPDGTAMEKMSKLIERIGTHREEQKAVRDAKSSLDYGSYDSVNINMISGGQMPNIIPARMSLVVDVRWAVHRDVKFMQRIVDSWLEEEGNGTVVEYIRRVEQSNATAVDDSNRYWVAIREALTNMEIKVKPVVCPAASDMINLRNIGIPALGFSPKIYTTNKVHSNDEYINAETFLIGIDIYVDIIEKLGNLIEKPIGLSL